MNRVEMTFRKTMFYAEEQGHRKEKGRCVCVLSFRAKYNYYEVVS